MESNYKSGTVTNVAYAAVPEEEKKEPRANKKRLGARWQLLAAPWKSTGLFRRTSTWRFIVCMGLSVAWIAVILNVAMLAWVRTAHSDNILFKGDCGYAKSTVTYSSLAINALSTLLLGASNAAMQCLCAPTRDEVDDAHASGSWLDIGISGVGNLKKIERWRKVAWVAILISSLPLHLLFNSVILVSQQQSVYVALMVTQDFTNGTTLVRGRRDVELFELEDHGPPASISMQGLDVYDLATSLQKNMTGLQRLENVDCIQAYGQPQVTKYLNVLLVTDASPPDTDLVTAGHLYVYPKAPDGSASQQASNFKIDNTWICNDDSDCDISTQAAHASDWAFTFNEKHYPVSHCLAQPAPQQCTVQILPQILGVVIACNVLKVLCFSALLFKPRFRPLMLLGDAVSSFMAMPDPDAVTQGPVSAEGVRKMYFTDPHRFAGHKSTHAGRRQRPQHQTSLWHAGRRRWGSVVGPRRWSITIFGFVALWFIGLAFLIKERRQQDGPSFSTLWNQGFGTPDPGATVPLGSSVSLVESLLVANSPQLVLSFIYLYYNDIFTCMLVSVEFIQYSAEHKGLRVTSPEGDQRGAYMLSLPLKVSVPLLIGAGILHWAMSQSLFLAEMRIIDPNGNVDSELSFTTLGWSALALLILLIIWGLMLVVVLAAGYRNFRRTAPPVGSNSRAILSASACMGDGAQEALKKVRYGVIGATPQGYKRVGFASGDVDELSDNELYA